MGILHRTSGYFYKHAASKGPFASGHRPMSWLCCYSSVKDKDAPILENIPIERIRNIGIIAHIDAGKTTTTERMLYYSGMTLRMGDVDRGDTVMDYLPQERKRGITITSASVSFPWENHRINLIDTPGHVDFTIEVERSIRVLDGAVAILDAVAGVEAQTETVWNQMNKHRLPGLVFMNKLDRDGANPQAVFLQLRARLENGHLAHFIQYPINMSNDHAASKSKTVVDLINLNLLEWTGKNGETIDCLPYGIWKSTILPFISAPQVENLIQARQSLLDFLSEKDDEFLELYLNDTSADAGDKLATSAIAEEIYHKTIRRLVLANKMIPILCGAALRNWGVQSVLRAVVRYFPSPVETGFYSTQIKDKRPRDTMIALAFKVTVDEQKGPMVFVRVYSGTLNARASLYNASKKTKERVSKIFHMFSNETKEIHSISTGNIGVLLGLRHTSTGDTLLLADEIECSRSRETQPIILDGIKAPAAVFFCAIEPNSLSDEGPLSDALNKLQLEDPSFRAERHTESGQLLVFGMGELHLDIIKGRLLDDLKVKAKIGPMKISYRESISFPINSAPIKKAMELNREMLNKRHHVGMEISLSRLSAHANVDEQAHGDKHFEWQEDMDIKQIVNINASAIKESEISANQHGLTLQELVPVLYDQCQCALKQGPLLGFPTYGLAITLSKIKIYPDTHLAAIRACLSDLMRDVLKEHSPILLEPLMLVQVKLSSDKYLGHVLNDINATRRGHVNQCSLSGSDTGSGQSEMHNHYIVSANIPLKELIGYATALRSLTAGTGSFDMKMIGYKQVMSDQLKGILLEHRGY